MSKKLLLALFSCFLVVGFFAAIAYLVFAAGTSYKVKENTDSPEAMQWTNQRHLAMAPGNPDGRLWACYNRKTPTNNWNIYCSYSNNEGESWAEEAVTTGGGASARKQSSIAVASDGTLHVIWMAEDGKGTLKSRDPDTGWGSEFEYTLFAGYKASIAVESDDDIHIVYDGDCIGYGAYAAIWHRWQIDSVWQTQEQIGDCYHTGVGLDQDYPSIAIDSSDNLHILWLGRGHGGSNPGGANIIYRMFTVGVGWDASVTKITDLAGNGSTPDRYMGGIAVDSSDDVHIVWRGMGYGANPTIYNVRYRKKQSGSWQADEAVTDEPNLQYWPTISIEDNDDIHVVWSGAGWGGANPSSYNIIHKEKSGTWQAAEKITDEAWYHREPSLAWARWPATNPSWSGPITEYALIHGSDEGDTSYDIEFFKVVGATWATGPTPVIPDYNYQMPLYAQFLEIEYPNGVGNYTAWSGVYTDVDENWLEYDDSNYVTTAADGDQESFTFTGWSGTATIVHVEVVVRAKRLYTDDNILLFYRTGGTDYEIGDLDPSTSYTVLTRVVTLDPSDDQQWTTSDITGMEWGLKKTGTSGAVYVTQMYVKVYPASVDGSTHLTDVQLVCDLNGQTLIDGGYLDSDGMNTYMTRNHSTNDYMVGTTKVGYMIEDLYAGEVNIAYLHLDTDVSRNYYRVYPGNDGYITVADDADLEIGDDFEVEVFGWIDPTQVGAHLVEKHDAFRIWVSASGEISAAIYTTDTFLSTNSDGFLTASNAVYATAHNQAVADAADNAGVTFNVGQEVPANYDIHRAFVYYQTGPIPDGTDIWTGDVSLFGQADNSVTDFDVVVRDGQPARPSDPLIAGDYDYTFYNGDGGSVSTNGWSLAGYNVITLNSTGLGWINDTGDTKLALISQEDIDSSVPAGDEYVTVHSANSGANQPRLRVTRAAAEVTATGLIAGEQVITVTGDGADLKIKVNGVEKDSDTVASAPDYNDDWIFLEGLGAPYATWVSLDVGGTHELSFYPDEIISGTTIEDEEPTGGDNDGTMTWGSPIEGITCWVGAVEPLDSWTSTTPQVEGDAPVYLVLPPESEMFQSGTGSNLPMYDVFNETAVRIGMSTNLLYLMAMLSTAMGIGFLLFLMTDSIAVALLAMIALMGGGVGAEIISMWILVLFASMAGALVYVMKRA